MQPQPTLDSEPDYDADEIAAGFRDMHGVEALTAANLTLTIALRSGVARQINLWRNVKAILEAEAAASDWEKR